MEMTRRVTLHLFALAVSVFFGNASTTTAQTAFPSDLDDYAARILKTFEVPGMAVAVVKDGKMEVGRGYGVRHLGQAPRVDTNTVFGIGSNSKAFTSALLAMLADEGKIRWDDQVIKYLPGFQMYDPWVTREMTIRDLLAHRSGFGIGEGDLLSFPATTFSREEIVRSLRFLKPLTSFRSQYAYDSNFYVVAGEVIHAVTGKTWDEYVTERIFGPLAMTASNTSIRAFRPNDNVATPHSRVDGTVTPILYNNIDNAAAAGGINSSAADMSKWMIVQLNRGVLREGDSDALRLFSDRQSREMWSSQTVLPIDALPPELAALEPAFLTCGLGWFLRDYRGHKIVWHTGGLAGMVSRVTLIPDQNFGIVVLTNQEDAGALQAMSYHILDSYLGLPATDWITAFLDSEAAERRKVAEAEKERIGTRVAHSTPSLPLARYAGQYRDAWYGDVTISASNDRLLLRFSRTPLLVGDLEHWQYDTFIVHWRDRSVNADAFVTFALKSDGTIDQMTMQAVSPLTKRNLDFQDLFFVPVGDGKKEVH